MRNVLVQNPGGLPHIHAVPGKLCRFLGQQAVAEAASLGIHDVNKAVRELFHQLSGHQDRRVIGSADTGAHRNINHIRALLQHRREVVDKQLCVQKRGADFLTVPQALVIGMSVKMIHIALIDFQFPVYSILAGEKRNSVQHRLRKISASVCKYGKSHLIYLLNPACLIPDIYYITTSP